MVVQLKIWRQKNSQSKGGFETYVVEDLSPDMSFLEALDQLNEKLILQGEIPVAFDHDCREGICGACSLVVNGSPQGPEKASAVCQLFMRSFKDQEEIWVEPFRAKAFPVIQDLMVDRSALDRIMSRGGYISVKAESAPEAHSQLVKKETAEKAFSFSSCIGCGACVAVCKNASANLFVAAKLAHLALLPQGQTERRKRTLAMTEQMQKEGFGSCTNTGACSRACPKEISIQSIAFMNKEYLKSQFTSD